MDEIMHHLAVFISRLWQIHIFGEGNTRTTAVFFIKYLRTLGFNVTNDIFAKNAWYFRNSLVRANYNDLNKDIHETTEFLELFLRNLLLNEKNELHNRSMHISGRFKADIGNQKTYIETEKENNLIEILDGVAGKKTIKHIIDLYKKCGKHTILGRSVVEQITGLKSTRASEIITLMLENEVIEPVRGHGKGKYRFK